MISRRAGSRESVFDPEVRGFPGLSSAGQCSNFFHNFSERAFIFQYVHSCGKVLIDKMTNQMIQKRLSKLRANMSALGIDYYLIPTADFHNSEYVAPYFQTRRYFSGFTGSSGTLIVGAGEAGLWTDGRYYIQAEKELSGTGIDLYRESDEGVPTPAAWLAGRLGSAAAGMDQSRVQHEPGGHQPSLAFDGRCVSVSQFRDLQRRLSGLDVRFVTDRDPAEGIWEDRPELPASEAFVLAEEYAGESAQSKVERLREKMRGSGAALYVENKLDNLMWLWNLRGRDVECTPVALCFGVVTMDRQILFIRESAVTEEVRAYAAGIGLELRPYEDIFEELEKPELYRAAAGADRPGKTAAAGHDVSSPAGEDAGWCRIYYSPSALSVRLYEAMIKGRDRAFGADNILSAGQEVLSAGKDIQRRSPVEDFKAVKNETELKNIRSCYLEDSAAVCRFLYWIHRHVVDGTIGTLTEMDAEKKMDSLRAEISDFIELSFKTISAYGPNAAMMHYSAKEDDCAQLRPEGMLLVDCGGQYLRGTTDVTRTMALGPVTEDMRRHYTLTAVGNLQLMDAVFLHGCTGKNVDILARQPLWNIMMDYKCGTGHGIGYLLGVHEGPQNIRWRFAGGAPEAVLETGMIVSDEPGVYLEGKYGIRIETILEVVEAAKNSDGTFLRFRPLTLVPMDRTLIDPQYLTPQTRTSLNEYHRRVFDEVSPLLTEEEREWLREQTQEI